MKGVEMVELVVLTSGVLAAGVGIYRYVTQNVRTLHPASVVVESPSVHSISAWETPAQAAQMRTDPAAERDTSNVIPRTVEMKKELQRGFNSSSVSLGLASTGLLFFAPLQYATIPALIYMGTPSARRAYELLYQQGRPSRALVETAVLAVCLGGGWYLAGSLGFWLYYLRRIAQHNDRSTSKECTESWALPHSVRLVKGVEERLVPIDTLRFGDQVLVETSEVVPVDGVIVHGAAWVQPAGAMGASTYCLKRAGERVIAADVVIAGRITLRVQKAK